MSVAIALVAFVLGFCLALKLVGYGVNQGLQQIVRLYRLRTGRCRCSMCPAERRKKPRTEAA